MRSCVLVLGIHLLLGGAPAFAQDSAHQRMDRLERERLRSELRQGVPHLMPQGVGPAGDGRTDRANRRLSADERQALRKQLFEARGGRRAGR